MTAVIEYVLSHQKTPCNTKPMSQNVGVVLLWVTVFVFCSQYSAPNEKLNGSAMHRNDDSDVVGCRLPHSMWFHCRCSFCVQSGE